MRTTKIFKHKPECIDLTLNEPREKPKVVDDDIVFIEEVKSDLSHKNLGSFYIKSYDETWVEKSVVSSIKKPVVASNKKTVVSSAYPSKTNNLRLGRRDFEFVSKLGDGGYGEVYLARKPQFPEAGIFAIKKIEKDSFQKQNHELRRVVDERKILEFINHPFLTKFHFAFQSAKSLYMGLEFVQGGELHFHLKKRNPSERMSEVQVKFYAIEVTMALQYLHENNIIYRDLKPENILLGMDGHIKLTDFGLCKFLNIQKGERTMSFCGTREYFAPEMIKRKKYGAAVDWWTLGILIYDLLFGKTPFVHQDKNVIEKLIVNKKPDLTGRELSQDAQDFIIRLLQKFPSKRLGNQNVQNKGWEDVKSHAFLKMKEKDWEKAYEKRLRTLRPPIVPSQPANSLDVFNFPENHEAIRKSDSSLTIKHEEDDPFANFDYVSPELEAIIRKSQAAKQLVPENSHKTAQLDKRKLDISAGNEIVIEEVIQRKRFRWFHQ